MLSGRTPLRHQGYLARYPIRWDRLLNAGLISYVIDCLVAVTRSKNYSGPETQVILPVPTRPRQPASVLVAS